MPPAKRTTNVRSHTRRDGTRVRSHNRENAWRQAGAAWAGVGVSTVTTLALVFEMGLTIVSTFALVITALVGLAAVAATQKATKNKRKMRAATQARKKGGKRSSSRSRNSSRRRR
ncbi:hypothetical protein ACFHW2_11615 [Actinomadura sp. LOL_016]|uniref:hypothetical protein n=1 Tax=unclassified Actinomadura TaxID=2626254 RepID=UPI003A8063FD